MDTFDSAVVTHGLPYPANLEAARRMERTIREHGAVPAAVALIGGRVRVGLAEEDLGYLAARGVVKVGRRDLAVAIARQASGGTTGSATLAGAPRPGGPVPAPRGRGAALGHPRRSGRTEPAAPRAGLFGGQGDL